MLKNYVIMSNMIFGHKKHIEPGKLTSNGVALEKHEFKTIAFLLSLGFDVSLIPRSTEVGVQTPDIFMLGRQWEIKCPKGGGKCLLQNTIQRAVEQSENIIVDLSRIRIPQYKCIPELERQLYRSKRGQRLKIITKGRKILDFSKDAYYNIK